MKVQSWGRYPARPQKTVDVYWRNDLNRVIQEQKTGFLAFGNGRSYGDSCLAESNQVINCRGINKLICLDWNNGIITAEAGLTLNELIDIALPKGWFLPVTPGTKYVTLGGAIANDVHGKNHHSAGTFGCHIKAFTLLRSDGEELSCSEHENVEFYNATIGGLGLTGIIKTVTLQLKPVTSNKIIQRTIKFRSLKEFFELSEAFENRYEYVVSWIDCLSGENTKGHFILGDHKTNGRLTLTEKSTLSFPFTPPLSMVNKLTLKPFNSLYFHKQRKEDVRSTVEIDSFFYPLDGILNWNRMYGPKGFQQYQCVVANDSSYDAIVAILNAIKQSGTGSFLAVLKVFGDKPSPGLLSFPMKGVTLALDFPQSNNNKKLFDKLDKIVMAAQGRLYPAKDAHMSAEVFQNGYPQWETLQKFKDPQISSQFWKRVTES